MTKSKRVGKNCKSQQDVTVNDFANSTFTSIRLKKSSSSVLNVLKKELEVRDSWDEVNDEEEHNLTDLESSKCDKIKLETKEHEDIVGNEYPFDVWFLISNHIRPEDVGRFAAICKTSLAVVQSVQFWIALYKRYYVKRCLPNEFQPECLIRYCGMRTSVIKALYMMYPPFVNHVRKNLGVITHPDILIGLKCIGFSFKKEDKNISYHFKFKLNQTIPFYREHYKSHNILELLNDIEANPERDHCIFRVLCTEHISIPPIIGQTLKFVSVTLSKGFCHHRLQLIFGPRIGKISSRNCPADGNIIILDPITNLTILNWWHPKYIANVNIPLINKEISESTHGEKNFL